MYEYKQYFHYHLFSKYVSSLPSLWENPDVPLGLSVPGSYTLLQKQYIHIHTVSTADTKRILHNILNALYCTTCYVDVIKQYLNILIYGKWLCINLILIKIFVSPWMRRIGISMSRALSQVYKSIGVLPNYTVVGYNNIIPSAYSEVS